MVIYEDSYGGHLLTDGVGWRWFLPLSRPKSRQNESHPESVHRHLSIPLCVRVGGLVYG